MRILCELAVALSMSFPAMAAEDPVGRYFFKTSQIYSFCKTEDTVCVGYVSAISDYASATGLFCPPKAMTTREAAFIFMRYVEAHPKDMSKEAALTVAVALIDLYACK